MSVATEVGGGDGFGDGDDDGVIGRIVAPKYVHVLTPGTYECVMVYGQDELRLLIS